MDWHRVVSQFWTVEFWPRACWRGGRIEGCCTRLPNLSGKEFAPCIICFSILEAISSSKVFHFVAGIANLKGLLAAMKWSAVSVSLLLAGFL